MDLMFNYFLSSWNVTGQVLLDRLRAVIGIAVTAKVRACVVGANIDTGRAAAGRALVAVLAVLDRAAAEDGDQAGVHTPSLLHPAGSKVQGLRAGGNGQTMSTSNAGKGPGYFLPDRGIRFPDGEIPEVTPAFLVHTQKTEDDFTGGAGKFPGQNSKPAVVMLRSNPVGENNRVIAPEYPFRTADPGQAAEGFNQFFFWRQVRFQVPSIRVKGKMEIVRVLPEVWEFF